ncbi:hypothetical protein EN828_29970 [Mesorhizobium sp. M2D.F.Ca.ET.185.01.1.1]|uniref:hypothetical protein n=1 Tax=unclassified Mesorhizobium TaxID=325217 RepID=UPI000FCA7856|nr:MULTISPECIES: hypothetical protein [unclassified Mesorhizobium]TGP73358.1 hypothetical protein EN870_29620 [bacterium M00.F.Ca.ET.227.01.1.1]TGP84370.1 hypothetical protein EN864_30365 [bacterium M00.F.Ca.ET.221.01.1.1]TGP86984.1 hypothetical protein EN865_29730 [bacterium M00.F.Ca.ET.222.01.1.1]TGT96314.1 hypothetical protein EN806_52400 [bacterium M00.F.Ca.ET.163.01.1.1]TGU22523.1 hypothetical protein EN799_51955 [bacterium M00.F.Ca.ET.156.01.1.1]TGU43143.1 hypothetical protein EN789_291
MLHEAQGDCALNLSEDEARLAERYRLLCVQQDSPSRCGTVAFVAAFAGGVFIVSAVFFGGGEEGDPLFIFGIGVCCLVAGGVLWFQERQAEKRRWEEKKSIILKFRSRGLGIQLNGQVHRLMG